jgi:hypothetical protein
VVANSSLATLRRQALQYAWIHINPTYSTLTALIACAEIHVPASA